MSETPKTEEAESRRFVSVDVETLLEAFEERLAIVLLDGRLSQAEAREVALADVRKRFRVAKRQ